VLHSVEWAALGGSHLRGARVLRWAALATPVRSEIGPYQIGPYQIAIHHEFVITFDGFFMEGRHHQLALPLVLCALHARQIKTQATLG
jgi:hypothetical protein